MNPPDVAAVNSRGRARIESGHPWVFRADLISGPGHDAASSGPSWVTVTDARGRTLGIATWAAHSKLALRMLLRAGQGGQAIEAPETFFALVQERLHAAWARRQSLELDRDAFRMVHAEADALPGLFVDVYADVAVIQTASVAMDANREAIAAEVERLTHARLVLAREDGSMRDFEGLARFRGVLRGTGSSFETYRLGDSRLAADLMTDGKTGGFLDQADNQAWVAALAPPRARALDAFTYHGGFALALARRGGDVLATDENPDAVARTRANAELNQLTNLQVKPANAFDLLRSLESTGERFDVVVLDPPAFAKRAGARAAADRAYKEIFLRGLRITEPGGLAVLCSCSGQVTRAQFESLVAAAAADSGRAVQVLDRRGAGRDHPELVGVSETGHLKCWVLRVL